MVGVGVPNTSTVGVGVAPVGLGDAIGPGVDPLTGVPRDTAR